MQAACPHPSLLVEELCDQGQKETLSVWRCIVPLTSDMDPLSEQPLVLLAAPLQVLKESIANPIRQSKLSITIFLIEAPSDLPVLEIQLSVRSKFVLSYLRIAIAAILVVHPRVAVLLRRHYTSGPGNCYFFRIPAPPQVVVVRNEHHCTDCQYFVDCIFMTDSVPVLST